jgi:hypothetical protein
MREAGLVDVAAAGSFPVGGPACDREEAATIRHVRGELLAAGLAEDAEIDAHLAAIHAGKLDLTLAPADLGLGTPSSRAPAGTRLGADPGWSRAGTAPRPRAPA